MDPDQTRPQPPLDDAQGLDEIQRAPQSGRTGDVEESEDLYQQAIEAYFSSPNYGQGLDHLKQAEESARAENVEKTEELYRQAIDAYRVGLHDAKGLGYSRRRGQAGAPETAQDVNRSFSESILAGADYELGVGIAGYASFLIGQKRLVEARSLLEEYVSPETDHQLIWVQYQSVLRLQGDVDRLCWAIATETANKKGEYPRGTTAERIVEAARRAEKEGAADVARELAERALETARGEGDAGGRWAALGLLGVLLEKAGTVDEAIRVWRDAFAEGSTDALTVERLAMNLEKRDGRAAVIELIDQALERELPASVENKLRTRRERCVAQAAGRKPKEVAAFTERAGHGAFVCRFQTQVKPPVVHLHNYDSTVRCYCHWQGRGAIVDLDLESGRELRRVDGLPGATYYHVAPELWALGTRRTGPVGQGVTNLHFFKPDGSLAKSTTVPDGTTEAAFGSDTWYVGCRDGALYAFEPDGELRWCWPVPGSERACEDSYLRPNPYFVAATADVVVCSARGDVYALRRDGAPLRAVAGSSKGQVFVYGADGGAKEVRDLGLSHCFLPARRGDGSVAADASSGTTVSLFRGGVQTGSFETETPPTGLRMLGDLVVMWSGRSVRVVDLHGALVWEVELTKLIEAFEVAGERIVCRAGPVIAFTRTRPIPGRQE